MPSIVPTIINGVNPKGKPLIIMECGQTDFGTVYFDRNCIANVLSSGDLFKTSESDVMIVRRIVMRSE